MPIPWRVINKWRVLSWRLVLVACHGLDGTGGAGADRLPHGTLVVLHRDRVIPPDQAGVFVPGTPIGDRYRYDAAGRLEVRPVNATFRTVVADRFTVVRVAQSGERFARPESGLRHVRLDDDGPVLGRFATALYLHSDRQPNGFRRVCSPLQDSTQNPRYLTVAEIRTVLAPVVTLEGGR